MFLATQTTCALNAGRHIYIYHEKLDSSTGLLLHWEQFLNLNKAIIQHPPFWEYITQQFTMTIYWGCMQQHITKTESVDILGWEFLDLLDQASWCHVGMARSLWLHRCGMGCHRHWCQGILLNSWCGGNSWSLSHLDCQWCRYGRCGLHAWCRWRWGRLSC